MSQQPQYSQGRGRGEKFVPGMSNVIPYNSDRGIQASGGPPTRKEYDIHETLKNELNRQRGLDDSVYDVNKFPIYSTRYNQTLDFADPGKNITSEGVLSPVGTSPGLVNIGDASAPTSALGTQVDRFLGASKGVSDQYIRFDSASKDVSSDPSRGIYVFNLRTINNSQPVSDIIQIEILPFFFQKIRTQLWQPNYFFYKKIFLQVEVGSVQQVAKTQNKSQVFHFEFDIQDAGIVNKAIPLNLYTFTEPIREISTLQAIFKIPNANSVNFNQDVFTVTSVVPAVLPPPGDRRMITSVPHGLTIGAQYAVYLTGFNSSSSVLNDIMNSTIGQIIDVIDAVTIQFTLTPGASAIGSTFTALGTAPTATMSVGELNVAFTIRFRTIRKAETNFIVPV